jgi:hypothetical protein
MVLTPSFTHLNIPFSNQMFSNCSLAVDIGFVEHTQHSFCGNALQDEYLVLLQFTCAIVVL